MDSVTDESTGSDGSDGCDAKSYSLLNVETQLELFEHCTTAMEKELIENEKVGNNPSQSSHEQAKSTDSDESQVNDNLTNEPSPTILNPITDDEDEELKVGDKVIYVGKKYQESIGNQVMEVAKSQRHWTGNQITCSCRKGWTTWIPENSLKKIY